MKAFWGRNRKSTFATVFCTILLTTSVLLMPTGSPESDTLSSTLRVGIQQDIPDFNIYNLGSNSLWKSTVLGWAYEGIAVVGRYSVPYPLLAQSWTFDEGTLTLDIYLQQGVLFHDGQEMLADDVHFSYLMAREGTVYSSQIIWAFDSDDDWIVTQAELNAGIQVMSDYHVRMVMAKPYSQFFSSTLTVPIVPKHIWENHVDSENRVDVIWGTDPAATIGTGPFYYAGGVDFDYRVLDKNTQYWGKSFVLPDGCSTYPPNVDRLHFTVEGSVDSAVNALRSGEIDHVAWPIPPSKIPLIDSDPAIDVFNLEDPGYFLLAFNEKKEPFGSIDFRRAVSHLIDKSHIVNAFMDGFGVEGTTAVSPYFGEWHNETLTDYVYDDPDDPLTTIPEDMLDAAGLADMNGDGWRDLPDGSVMKKITILAPPADYDPVRIRSAEMIANDLAKVGINAEALAVDFSTLVAKLNSFDYDMVIIGFSFAGYSNCVSVLFDIYGHAAASNTWAFWSDANWNPFHSWLGEMSTLADEETMMLVDYLAELEDEARATFDVAEQIACVRQAQELVLDAVPCNPLYHRVNAMATSASWTGWVPHMGTLLNRHSLSALTGGGVDRTFLDADAPGVTVAISAPRTLSATAGVNGYVEVMGDFGDLVPNANVSVTFEPISPSSSDLAITPSSGVTNSEGLFWFTVSATTEGVGVLKATAEKGGYEDEDSMIVTVSAAVPKTLTLHAEFGATVLGLGDAAEISLMVQDECWQPVEGAEISVDEQLLGAGEILPEMVVTDATGSATMSYSAFPWAVNPGSHFLERVLLTVSKAGYEHTDSAYVEMLVYNDAPPDWAVVKVSNVTTTALSYEAPVSTIAVRAVDDEGNALASAPLAIEYSNESYVSMPVISAVTDSEGYASFDVEVAEGAPTGAFKATVQHGFAVSSVATTITLTYIAEGSSGFDMYGGYISYDEEAQFMPAMGTLHATAYVWDENGDPAEGKAALVVPASMEGTIVWSDQTPFDSHWDYLGVKIDTYADECHITTSGPLNAPELSTPWVTLEGVDMVAGEVEFMLYGTDVSLVDLLGEVIVVPNGAGGMYVIYSLSSPDSSYGGPVMGYMITGMTTIVGEYAYGRSYEVLSASHEIPAHFVGAFTDTYDTTSVTATVTDQHNDPVDGAEVLICQNPMGINRDYGVLEYSYDLWTPSPTLTDAYGNAEVTVVAVGLEYAVADSFVVADVTAVSEAEGAISLMSQSQLFIRPQKCMIETVPITIPVVVGEDVIIEAQVINVTDECPLADMVVSMYAGLEETVTDEAVTGSDGMVSFTIDTSSLLASEGGFIPVTLSASGPGYYYAASRMMVPANNPRPEIHISEPAEGAVLAFSTVVISGTVTDLHGVASVTVTVDGGPSYVVPITVGDTTVAFEHTAYGLYDGPHYATVEAIDMLQVSSVELRSFVVSANQFVLVRYGGPVSESKVTKAFQPETDGMWKATVENNGLSGVAIFIYEVDGSLMTELARMKIRFQGDPDAVMETVQVSLSAGCDYVITYTPLGPEGGSALVIPSFEAQYLAMPSSSVNV